jgi:tetratricopeptide (TPR) repeat protein
MSQDSPPFQDKNPFQVLGLQGTEDVAAIRKAFLDIATKSHPDRLRTKSEEVKAQALETFLLAKKAYEVLSQPDKRREWSERLARPKPTVTPAPIPPRPGPALTPASRAVPVYVPPARPSPAPSPAPVASASPDKGLPTSRGTILPSAAALQLYKLGLLALEASDYAKALDLFGKAAKLSPTPRHQALELVARGHQYLSTRFFDRARESFERALQLHPDCREARAGLEAIEKQSGRYLKGR